MRWRRGVPAMLAVVLVACASDPTTAPSTPAPSSDSTTPVTTVDGGTEVTSTTDEVTTTVPASDLDRPAELSTADLPTDAPCAVGTVPEGGQVTFVVDGKLWGVDQQGTVACLADLQGRNPTWISWSPDGDEVLVGPDVVLRNDGRFVSTGYFPDNRLLRWSAPTGKALLAPNAQTGHLIWRNAHDSTDRIDVSFTQRTTAAAYHPAGKHIVAAGIGNDGQGQGVFLATNRGANVQRIGSIDAGDVTDLSFEMSGDSIVFLHHHPDGLTELHRYTFSNAVLEVVATEPVESVDHLVASPVDDRVLAWSTAHSTLTSVLHVLAEPFGAPVSVSFPESVLTPLSWMPNRQILFGRSSPGAVGATPFEVWSWSGGNVRHLIDGVSAAAARTVHGPYLELNIIQGSGFG